MQDPNDEKLKRPVVQRQRFGGTDRPTRTSKDLDPDRLPPIDSSELSKGPAELADERGSRVNWRVFIVASLIILAFSVWAMLMQGSAHRR